MPMMPMWGYSNSPGFGGMLWGWLPLLLCLIGFGLLVWALLSMAERAARRNERMLATPDAEPGALETLQRRYARGEIDESSYLRMRQQLGAPERAASELTAPGGAAR